MYMALPEVIDAANRLSYPSVKIETNGGPTFIRFVERYHLKHITEVAFSVDGHDEESTTRTRGPGRFKYLLQAASMTKQLNVPFYGIVSLSKLNADCAVDIIAFCNDIGCQRVTVHYVSERGDSLNNISISPSRWLHLFELVQRRADNLSIPIKWEESFASVRQWDNPLLFECAVRNHENLMVMPDGTSFLCTMFLDHPELAAYNWTGRRFLQRMGESEILICDGTNRGCPAWSYTRSIAQGESYVPVCAFRKKLV